MARRSFSVRLPVRRAGREPIAECSTASIGVASL
jgi:hypothetical protein